MSKTKCLIILGPTSSGKSDLAVKLAKKLEKDTGKQSEIISVDSRQIYKDMNLGTGKVEGKWEVVNRKVKSSATRLDDPAEQTRSDNPFAKGRAFHSASPRSKGPALLTTSTNKIFTYKNTPHYLIDFADPPTHSQEKEKYTVVNFRQDALQLIKEISQKNKLPIIVGGTGFWISALVDNPQFPQVKPNKKLRAKLSKKSAEELLAILKKQDPTTAKRIDPQNKFRLIRALEICEALGTVPEIKNNPPKDIDFLQIGLDWPKDKLAEKIKKRLESRWTDGMIKEVKNLKKKYEMSWEEIQTFGLAYYWIPLYLQNKLTDDQKNIITDPVQTKEELIKRVYFAEKNYAKRQRTWFKRDKRIIWKNDFKEILKLTKNFLR